MRVREVRQISALDQRNGFFFFHSKCPKNNKKVHQERSKRNWALLMLVVSSLTTILVEISRTLTNLKCGRVTQPWPLRGSHAMDQVYTINSTSTAGWPTSALDPVLLW